MLSQFIVTKFDICRRGCYSSIREPVNTSFKRQNDCVRLGNTCLSFSRDENLPSVSSSVSGVELNDRVQYKSVVF